jgi:hypothetical protein
MFELTADIVKLASLILAIALPTISSICAYRAAERQSKVANVGKPGIQAIGAALLTESSVERAMQTAHECRESINRLARVIEKFNEDSDVRDRIFDRLCDEMTACRRALEEGVSVLKRRD